MYYIVQYKKHLYIDEYLLLRIRNNICFTVSLKGNNDGKQRIAQATDSLFAGEAVKHYDLPILCPLRWAGFLEIEESYMMR